MVIASILTNNNQEGLNALLWSLYSQTVRETMRIRITNTGRPILGNQIWGTINHISQKINIELKHLPNTKNYGILKEYMIHDLKDEDVVWYLEDDNVVIDRDLLEKQMKSMYTGEFPNVPMFEELGFDINEGEEVGYQINGGKERIRLGNIFGLLCKVKMIKDIKDLDQWCIGADMKMIRELNPYLIDGKIIHSKSTSPKANQYILQERLMLGKI